MMSWLARQDGYDPNAFDVPGEQGTNVGWANRLGEILTTRPTYDEQTVLHSTASPLVNITEGDIGRATEAAMAVSGGGMKVETPKGIRAYHSSPHDFDKFDLAKIGTGEGAQAYGHGLYFAESPAVSGQGGQYWQQFLPRMSADEQQAARRLAAENFDRKAAIETTQQILDRAKYPERFADQQRMLELLKGDKPVGPRTYEVNINADPAHMLDWDKALTQQSKSVQEALGITPEVQDALMMHKKNPRPRSFYDPELWQRMKLLDDDLRGSTIAGNDAAKSAALREAGIPGIKYLDQGSRAQVPTYRISKTDADNARYTLSRTDHMARDMANKGFMTYAEAQAAQAAAEAADAARRTSNYVIFDPNIIDITKKYAVPGALTAGGMGALAAQNRYEEVY